MYAFTRWNAWQWNETPPSPLTKLLLFPDNSYLSWWPPFFWASMVDLHPYPMTLFSVKMLMILTWFCLVLALKLFYLFLLTFILFLSSICMKPVFTFIWSLILREISLFSPEVKILEKFLHYVPSRDYIINLFGFED